VPGARAAVSSVPLAKVLMRLNHVPRAAKPRRRLEVTG
jgi:hypothetical protein